MNLISHTERAAENLAGAMVSALPEVQESDPNITDIVARGLGLLAWNLIREEELDKFQVVSRADEIAYAETKQIVNFGYLLALFEDKPGLQLMIEGYEHTAEANFAGDTIQ